VSIFYISLCVSVDPLIPPGPVERAQERYSATGCGTETENRDDACLVGLLAEIEDRTITALIFIIRQARSKRVGMDSSITTKDGSISARSN
jgi:hypothetical protein